jgi:two-component system nitrogen regulation response regulator NtrX
VKNNILIIDDDVEVRSLIADVLSDEGYATFPVGSESEAFACLRKTDFDLVFLDLWIGEDESAGLKILKKIKNQYIGIPVVIISGHGTIDVAVSAIQNGALDFIEKPFVIDRLLLTTNRAIELFQLRKENTKLKNKRMDLDVIGIGKSQFVTNLKSILNNSAKTNGRIFIETYPGMGAENIAYYIHRKSNRKDYPFFHFNCSSDVKEKTEVDLFGKDKILGCLEKTNFGTLFLENVTELSQECQCRLLQYIQEGRIDVENRGNVYIDVRLICSHNANSDMSRFNQDLFYRLNIVNIKLVELKNRREDILPLVDYYIQNAESFFGLKPKFFTDECKAVLQSYEWPGNIYQVKSIVENSLINALEDIRISKKDLPAELTASTRDKFASLDISRLIAMPLKKARDAFEIDYLKAQIERFSGNISRTAEFVGMERSALHRKLKSLDMKRSKEK